MRIALTVVLFLCGTLAHAEHFAPYSCGAGESYAVDVGGGTEGALGYGFAVASAETGVGIAAGVASGLRGMDVAITGYYTMVNSILREIR